MSPLLPVYAQYRTLDHLVLFKAKSDQTLVITIYTISQERIFKKALSSAETDISDHRLSLVKESSLTLVEKLIKKKILSKKLLPTYAEISMQECFQSIQQVIHQIKAKVVIENDELQKFTCPLTLEVFQDPVIDEHGHTFEKGAIKRHLKNSNLCPLNRQPIQAPLTPNRLIRQIIEEAQSKDPIPTFALFIDDKADLAAKYIKKAETYEKEEDFEEALKAYACAFKYTKNSSDYFPLPLLFQRMQQTQKAVLAFLYLAQYQLQPQEEQIYLAIDTLKKALEIDPHFLPILLLIVKLYRFADNLTPAFDLLLEKGMAFAFSKEYPQEVIALYKQTLILAPDSFHIYCALESLLENPQEKAHLLLKGACHALQKKEYQNAQDFYQKAESYQPDSFIDQLIYIELLKQHSQGEALKDKLLSLAKTYHQKQLFPQKLQVYKMLIHLENNPFYYRGLIRTYEQLQKPHKALQWRQKLLPLLMQNQDWQAAEALAQEILKDIPQSLPLYENLETIYTQWQSHKLCDLYAQLGKAQLKNHQIVQAETTYRKAFEHFHTLEHALALAETLQEQNKIVESVQIYYEAATIALMDEHFNIFHQCVQRIRQIDPKLRHLDLTQRMHLLAQNQIFQLQKEGREMRAEISKLQEKLDPFKLVPKVDKEEKLKITVSPPYIPPPNKVWVPKENDRLPK